MIHLFVTGTLALAAGAVTGWALCGWIAIGCGIGIARLLMRGASWR